MNHILIVDDEPDLRFTFRAALENEENAIEEAASGVEALVRLGDKRFNLILLDLRMPQMDGLDFLTKLRARNDDTPVVMITAYGTVPKAVQAMKLGAIDVLEKPIKPEQLRHVVDLVIQRHRVPAAQGRKLSKEETICEGKRLINLRQFKEAKQLLLAGFEYPDPDLHNLLGLLAEAEGDTRQAWTRYKMAILFDGNFRAALENKKRLDPLVADKESKTD